MYQIPLDNINFRPLDIWGLGVAAITDFLYYDPASAYVDNAQITNRGTSGTNAVGYSGKSYDFDGVSDFVTLSVSATLTYIELWVKPDTTTMAICDFGAGKEIALTTGTVGTTGLGTVSVTVDGVSSTSMVALKWQLLRVTLDTPTAITTLRLGRNDTTYGSGQISDVQINDSTSYLETNQASSTGIFDSVQGVLATNSGCALIEGLSGLENGETHNGIPQSFSKNWNRYSSTSLTGTTSLSGTALTGSGTTFTTELAANDIVRVAGNIARVTSVTDNTNAVVVNITSGSWSAQSTVRLRLDGSDQLLPEDANNAGFDVGGLAIVDPQPKFKFDGASYLEGEVLTIDWDTAFEIEFDVVFYNGNDGNFEILFENADAASSFRGIQVYKNTSGKIQYTHISNNAGGTLINLLSSIIVDKDTLYTIKITHDGSGLAAGYTFEINNVDVKTVITNNLGSNTTVTTNPLNIGRRQSNDTLQLNGSITNFKFNYL